MRGTTFASFCAKKKTEFLPFTLASLPKVDEHRNRLCRASLNQQHTKEASPHFRKFKQAASVFAQSAVNVYFHICVKMLLSKILGGIGDKVIHLISLFRLFPDLV